MNPLTQSKNTTILPVLIAVAVAMFALSPQARADCRQGCDLSLGNTFLGDNALVNNTIGTQNTATGADALGSNNTGTFNTAIGAAALSLNNSGTGNTATGVSALAGNTTGSNNTANGVFALASNDSGGSNTANGVSALAGNTTGSNNTANGVSALAENNSGSSNTATGRSALASNNTGDNNTANGFQALLANTDGFQNTATGVSALNRNQNGSGNTANGVNALFANTTGGSNTANGRSALNKNKTGSFNTANGVNALFSNTSGSSNIALGASAGQDLTTGDNNIDIGNAGVADEANTIRIGTETHTATYIAGINGNGPFGATVQIDPATGQLGTNLSSARFKKDIDPMDKSSEAIFSLKPVTFHYKSDKTNTAQFGLIAEEVAKVNPALIAVDKEGKPYTVRYEAVNAMLLNEFLKEHGKVEQLEKQVAALTAGLQKVSAQLELRSSPQTVLNNR